MVILATEAGAVVGRWGERCCGSPSPSVELQHHGTGSIPVLTGGSRPQSGKSVLLHETPDYNMSYNELLCVTFCEVECVGASGRVSTREKVPRAASWFTECHSCFWELGRDTSRYCLEQFLR